MEGRERFLCLLFLKHFQFKIIIILKWYFFFEAWKSTPFLAQSSARVTGVSRKGPERLKSGCQWADSSSRDSGEGESVSTFLSSLLFSEKFSSLQLEDGGRSFLGAQLLTAPHSPGHMSRTFKSAAACRNLLVLQISDFLLYDQPEKTAFKELMWFCQGHQIISLSQGQHIRDPNYFSRVPSRQYLGSRLID